MYLPAFALLVRAARSTFSYTYIYTECFQWNEPHSIFMLFPWLYDYSELWYAGSFYFILFFVSRLYMCWFVHTNINSHIYFTYMTMVLVPLLLQLHMYILYDFLSFLFKKLLFLLAFLCYLLLVCKRNCL